MEPCTKTPAPQGEPQLEPQLQAQAQVAVLVAGARQDCAAVRVQLQEVGEAVRSLAEDLAVARVRSSTAVQDSREAVARACAAIERAEALSAQLAQRLEQAESARAQVAARAGALGEEVQQLRTALDHRPQLQHAVGVVMLVLGCDADAAWKVLTRLSQHTNRKVRHIADSLTAQVACGAGPSEDLVAVLRLLQDSPEVAVGARRRS
ncbi:ANTAR domain-containing protein [Kineococcus sp. SYSU DK005]|uniref:ANTAR domain-containing protein n=1 Tax=Kineococcus sp. SYSU DK005 TaxID=3383126 RepID=UPI003D7D692F